MVFSTYLLLLPGPGGVKTIPDVEHDAEELPEPRRAAQLVARLFDRENVYEEMGTTLRNISTAIDTVSVITHRAPGRVCIPGTAA